MKKITIIGMMLLLTCVVLTIAVPVTAQPPGSLTISNVSLTTSLNLHFDCPAADLPTAYVVNNTGPMFMNLPSWQHVTPVVMTMTGIVSSITYNSEVASYPLKTYGYTFKNFPEPAKSSSLTSDAMLLYAYGLWK